MKVLWWLTVLLFSLTTPASADARWVVISVPGLHLADLDDARLPTLRRLAQQGAVALMNTVTGASLREGADTAALLASAYLTIGRARRAYAQRAPAVGQEARQLTLAEWDSLAGTASGLASQPAPASLEQWGIRIGLIAAADADGGGEALLALSAPGAPIAAGGAGTRWLRRDAARPYGVIADVDGMAADTARLVEKVDLLWLDPGDLQRAATYGYWCLPDVAAGHRRAALAQAERLLLLLDQKRLFSSRDVLLIAPVTDQGRYGLAPVVWMRADRQRGLLISAATHTAGLLANTDVMPHLVASLLQESHTTSPLRLAPSREPLRELRSLGATWAREDRTRAQTMPVFKVWLMLGLLVAFPAAGFAPGRRARRLRLAWPLAVPVAAVVLGTVVEGVLWPWPLLAAAAWIVMRTPAEGRAAAAGAGLILLLLLDLAWGPALLRGTPLGYSLALGARYYGIGNEWMGYLSGAALLLALRDGVRESKGLQGRKAKGEGRNADQSRSVFAGLFALRPSPFALGGPSPFALRPLARRCPPGLLAALPMLLLGIVFAHPGWGADFGGALTAACGVAAIVAVRTAPRQRQYAIALGLGLAVAVVGAAGLDARRSPDRQTHLGRFVTALREEGIAHLGGVVNGKLATNARLATGYWGLLLACEAGACVWLALSTRRRRGREGTGAAATVTAGSGTRAGVLSTRIPTYPSGLAVFLVTAGAAAICNDSGVIAAALLLSVAPALPYDQDSPAAGEP